MKIKNFCLDEGNRAAYALAEIIGEASTPAIYNPTIILRTYWFSSSFHYNFIMLIWNRQMIKVPLIKIKKHLIIWGTFSTYI